MKILQMIGNILVYSLIYLMVQAASIVAYMIPILIKYYQVKTQEQLMNMVYSNVYTVVMVASIITLAIYYLMFRKKDINLFQICQIKKVSVINVILIIISALVLSFITSSFLDLTQNIFKDYSSISEEMVKGLQSIPGIISAVLIAPIMEETLFRGLIFNELRKNINLTASIIIQAVIFGVFHGNLAQGIYAAVLGIVLAVIYLWTKSIVANIIMHVSFNIVGTLVVPQIYGNTEWLVYIYLIGGVFILVGLLFLLYISTHNKLSTDTFSPN